RGAAGAAPSGRRESPPAPAGGRARHGRARRRGRPRSPSASLYTMCYKRGWMRIGFHLTPFWSPTDRGPTRVLDEAVPAVAAAARMGYAWVSIGQHWLSHPTVWPQPFPVLARLAPETGAMRLKTSVLLLPILNPVEVAESVATLDHICHGRLDVG